MENFRPIDYQQTRDFSRKINATFEFVRQNFKPLSKSILFIAGPAVLVGAMMGGAFMGDYMGMIQSMQSNPEAITNYFTTASVWLQLLLMFVFLLVGFVVAIATINNYIILYGEKKSNQIEVSEVWERVRSTFWVYLVTSLLFFVVGIVAYVVLLIPIFILGAISPFLIFFGIVIFICGIMYALVSSSLTYFIQLQEKKGFFDALARSFKLIRDAGKWWSTFGTIFILYMIVGVVSYIFLIPYYAMLITSTFHSVSTGTAVEQSSTMHTLTIIFFTLYYMAQMMLYALPNVGIAFQYFNLVEITESKGLMSRIEEFGKTDDATNRPEEKF